MLNNKDIDVGRLCRTRRIRYQLPDYWQPNMVFPHCRDRKQYKGGSSLLCMSARRTRSFGGIRDVPLSLTPSAALQFPLLLVFHS